jgi:DUF4097 and DUF4098 domain-containing protein YvlB
MTTKYAAAALAFLGLGMLAGAGPAADRAVNETRAVDAKARISIENMAGLVDVAGWDRNEVQVTGTLDEKAEKLAIEGSGSSLSIEVRYPQRRNLNVKEGSRLTIKVPLGCELEVEGVSAEVIVDGVVGKVSAKSVSGDLLVRGAPADLDLETVSGGITGEVTGASASLATVSGDVVAHGVAGKLKVSTVSGEIEVRAAGPVTDLSSESVSGSMTIVATPAGKAQWDISAHSGDVDLTVPANVDARFTVGTFSGSIEDGFGHAAERTNKFAPGSELKFTQGAGGAEIDVESFSGDVVIHKN